MIATLAASAIIAAQAPRWTPPYEPLPAPQSAAPYLQKLGDANHLVYVEGDVLHLVYRSEDPAFRRFNSLNLRPERIGQSDVYLARARYEKWDEVFFTYGYPKPNPENNSPMTNVVWRGESAPRSPEERKDLKGTITQHVMASRALGETRNFVVYIPPGNHKDLPAMFLADGTCEPLAQIIEPKIEAGEMRPVAIVGVESGGYRGDRAEPYDQMLDFRAREYLKLFDPERFGQHLEFFAKELVGKVTRMYGLSTRREDRLVGGFSNGGAFALMASAHMPEVFGHAAPLSIAAYDSGDFAATIKGKNLPQYHLCAGTLEIFILNTEEAQEILAKGGHKSSLEIYETGHDFAMWREHYLKAAMKAFPPTR